MATQHSLSQLTCEVLRLRLKKAKLSTTGNKATLVKRLLEHEGSHDLEHQQLDDSSSGSSDDQESSDRALTDRPGGRGCSRGRGGCGRSQGPSGLGRLVRSGGRPYSEECGGRSSSALSSDRDRSGGPRDSGCPEGPGGTGRGRSRRRSDPPRSASPEEILLQPRRQRRPRRCRASDPAPVTPRVHTRGRATEKHPPHSRRRAASRSRSPTPARDKVRPHNRRPSAGQQDCVVTPPLLSAPAHGKAPPFFPRSRPRDADDGHRRRRGAKRRRAHHTGSSSRSGSSSSSSSSDSSSSSRDRRRHHHRRRRSSSLEAFSDPLFISCSATPAKYLLKRIRRGKFVAFDKLLLPVLDETLAVGQAAKRTRDSRSAKRRVVDLATWLEAWNIFLAVRLQVSPSSALQLAKYQAIMCQLFSSYPVGVCIKYDSLFRQAVARDKSHLTPWDQVKDDILLWCATRHPFRTPKQPSANTLQSSATNGATKATQGRATHTQSGQEICRKFNYASCTRAECSFAHKCWVTGCLGDHPGKSCPRAPAAPG